MNSIPLMTFFGLIQMDPSVAGRVIGTVVGIIVALLFMRWLHRKK